MPRRQHGVAANLAALRKLDGGLRLITDASGWLLSSPSVPPRLKQKGGERAWLDGRMRRCGARDDCGDTIDVHAYPGPWPKPRHRNRWYGEGWWAALHWTHAEARASVLEGNLQRARDEHAAALASARGERPPASAAAKRASAAAAKFSPSASEASDAEGGNDAPAGDENDAASEAEEDGAPAEDETASAPDATPVGAKRRVLAPRAQSAGLRSQVAERKLSELEVLSSARSESQLYARTARWRGSATPERKDRRVPETTASTPSTRDERRQARNLLATVLSAHDTSDRTPTGVSEPSPKRRTLTSADFGQRSPFGDAAS